jgi:hypothetical protein
VVARPSGVQAQAEQHDHEHDRARWAAEARHRFRDQPPAERTVRDRAEAGQPGQHDRQADRRTGHLQGGAPRHATKAHPGAHRQREVDGDDHQRQLGRALAWVWVPEQRWSGQEQQRGQDPAADAHRHAHLEVVAGKLPDLAA